MLTYPQSVIMGLVQGVTELFPVSSLGHSVLLPAVLGWHGLVRAQSSPESFFLAFVVGLHVATALALLVHFRTDWIRIIEGLLRSIRRRRVETSDERLAWLLVIGTIPIGVVGLAFEHPLRTLFAKPLAAAIFLTTNGALMLAGERLRRRVLAQDASAHAADHSDGFDTLGPREALVVGSSQIGALFAGISRSGVTMVAGLWRGLSHEDAARFSFLLATPVILLAGLYKIPDLFSPLGNGIRGQVLVGTACAALAAYASVRFLLRYFQTRTLTPFAVYCLVAGIVAIVRFA